MTLAVLVRSVPVALAIGIAWIGPIEHMIAVAVGATVFARRDVTA